MLVALRSCAGDILSANALSTGHVVVVSHQADDLPLGGLQFHIGGELRIVGEMADEGVPAAADGLVVAQAVILPERDGTGKQTAQGRASGGYAQFVGAAQLLGCTLVPFRIEAAGVVADVILAEAIVGGLAGSGAVGEVLAGIPAVVGKDLHAIPDGLEEKRADAAAHMAEAAAAEVPYQHGYAVLPGLEVRGDVHGVVISVTRSRAALEPALVHNHLAVDPEPVLAVGCDLGGKHVRNGLELHFLLESLVRGSLLRGARRHGYHRSHERKDELFLHKFVFIG